MIVGRIPPWTHKIQKSKAQGGIPFGECVKISFEVRKAMQLHDIRFDSLQLLGSAEASPKLVWRAQYSVLED